MKEVRVDSEYPSFGHDVRSSLLSLSPDGPWLYAILLLVQIGGVVVVTRIHAIPFGLTLATLFVMEGIVCMVVAWFLSGREGDIGAAARAQTRRAQLAGAPDLATVIPEHQADFDTAARNAPLILILVLYGAILLGVAFVAVL